MRTPHGTPWTPAEKLWAGAFGDAYQARSPGNVEANKVLFARILSLIDHPLWSVLEMGAGVGSNLAAIKAIDSEIETTGLEINAGAFQSLATVADEAIMGSLLGFIPGRQWQLVFTKGVLIHIPPARLDDAYAILHRASSRYILLAEYYNPTPVAIPYRGQENALWKRDFAGEMLDAYPDLRLLDYGFVYHRDPHPQDDLTWFLMEKRT